MTEQIKVGVLGVGALGRHHARLYQQCANARLMGIYDRNPDQAKKIADELETPHFATIEELADAVDALSIAVPTNVHLDVAKQVMAMDKHILIEKPITETVAQAQELLTMADERGLIVQVGHVERFNPVISYLESKMVQPRFIESHRLSPYPPARPGLPPRGTEVSVVLDLMIHDIDMVLSLNPSPVIDVDAVGVPILSPSEDLANARLKFENGCVANLTASRVTPEPMRKIRVFQSNSYISLDYMDKSGYVFTKDGSIINREAVPVEDYNALLKELEHFIDCIGELHATGVRPTPKVSGQHGMKALDVAEQIIALIRSSTPTLD